MLPAYAPEHFIGEETVTFKTLPKVTAAGKWLSREAQQGPWLTGSHHCFRPLCGLCGMNGGVEGWQLPFPLSGNKSGGEKA